MHTGGITKQIARWVALSALFLIPITPLLVANSFFFPFITGKAFYFRILVEIGVAAWVLLALLDKQYRPRFSWIAVMVVWFVCLAPLGIDSLMKSPGILQALHPKFGLDFFLKHQ